MFDKRKQLSALRRRLLPAVQTIVDDDILVAIGAAQEVGEPHGFKEMAELKLACLSTLQRRIDRLVKLRLVERKPDSTDGRRVAYTLTPKTISAYSKLTEQALLA